MSAGEFQSGRKGSTPWPTAAQFNEAIQNPRTSLADDELQGGTAVVNASGLPMPYAGNFADVYQVHCPASGHTWAVKFFRREVPNLRERYRAISQCLDQARLPFMVDFRYLDQGVRIVGRWYPIVKMRWIEGQNLNRFVAQSLDQPQMLDQLFNLWVKLAARLRSAGIAHADLQHGNAVLVPKDDQGRLALKLVDYDGMYVPALAGRRSGEEGHPSYQHPQRSKEGIYSVEVDRFSHLVICCALRCLRVGGRPLWERFDDGENLLFRGQDFLQPAGSALFRELWTLRQADAHALVGQLVLATGRPLEQTPLLEDLVRDGQVRPLTGDEQREAQALLQGGAGAGTAVAVPSSLPPPSPVPVPQSLQPTPVPLDTEPVAAKQPASFRRRAAVVAPERRVGAGATPGAARGWRLASPAGAVAIVAALVTAAASIGLTWVVYKPVLEAEKPKAPVTAPAATVDTPATDDKRGHVPSVAPQPVAAQETPEVAQAVDKPMAGVRVAAVFEPSVQDHDVYLRAVAMRWPNAYALDRDGDLWIFEARKPATDTATPELSHLTNVGDGYCLAIVGQHLYTGRRGNLAVYALDGPRAPRPIGEFGYFNLGETKDIVVEGERVYVIGRAGIAEFDISNHAKPQPLRTLPAGRNQWSGMAAGGLLYVSELKDEHVPDSRNGFAVYRVDDRTGPPEIGFVETRQVPYHLQLLAPQRFVLATGQSLELYDLADARRPSRVGEVIRADCRTVAATTIGGRQFVATNGALLMVEGDRLVQVAEFQQGSTGDGFPYRGSRDGARLAVVTSKFVTVLACEELAKPPDRNARLGNAPANTPQPNAREAQTDTWQGELEIVQAGMPPSGPMPGNIAPRLWLGLNVSEAQSQRRLTALVESQDFLREISDYRERCANGTQGDMVIVHGADVTPGVARPGWPVGPGIPSGMPLPPGFPGGPGGVGPGQRLADRRGQRFPLPLVIKLESIERVGQPDSLARVGSRRDARSLHLSEDAIALVSKLRQPGTKVTMTVERQLSWSGREPFWNSDRLPVPLPVLNRDVDVLLSKTDMDRLRNAPPKAVFEITGRAEPPTAIGPEGPGAAGFPRQIVRALKFTPLSNPVADPPPPSRASPSAPVDLRGSAVRSQFVPPSNSLALEDTGTLEGVRPGVLLFRDRKNDPWLLTVVPQTAMAIEGQADSDYLRPGMTVELTGEIDNKNALAEPIVEISVMAGKGNPMRGLFPPDDDPQEAKPLRNPEAGKYRIRGKLASVKQGELLVVAGRTKITGTLADDTKVKLNLDDASLAQPGDKVKVKAWYYDSGRPNATVNRPGRGLAEEVSITLSQPPTSGKQSRLPVKSTRPPAKADSRAVKN